jgi:hypothetical protein
MEVAAHETARLFLRHLALLQSLLRIQEYPRHLSTRAIGAPLYSSVHDLF